MKIDIKEIMRFVIVGGIATIIHYGIYLLLIDFLNPNSAYSIGYIISLSANFVLSANYTFKRRITLKKGVGFLSSHIINYLLHMLLLNTFISSGIQDNLAPIPVYAIVIPINFLLIRFVFKSNML